MFSRKKIAAIVALMGGLTAASALASQAHAEGGDQCSRGETGNKVCVHKYEAAYRTKDGKRIVIDQEQRCASTARDRVVWPENGLLGDQETNVGPQMNCSNHFSAPKGFKGPHVNL
ncbi:MULTISPECIES: hypothetical protein [Streptomyces]|uniref:hypothetical protein n=1 Tax=Streptomyces TaxID=1883 RepID=UPI0019627819|nr:MULTISPECIES: hypothetical protein [Streptomyces]QRX96281.1 hypothetical protein JNO44_40730 [Streptomyces noursei]UJB44964.1 hypothetical protein HRD51_33000 [Streptomyces sp. A1-5]